MSDQTSQPPAVNPVRYGWRDGSAAPSASPPVRPCPVCAAPLPSARARYCSEACKQRAYRLRQVDRTTDDLVALAARLKRLRALAAHTVYECPGCDGLYLGEQRCAECNQFCRAVGLGGACPHCEEPVRVADLLGEEVGR